MKASVDIKSYTLGDLEGLLSDKNFWELDPLPINKQRIVSKIRNPRASRDDLALVVAFENGHVIGYCGVFSDQVFINGNPQKAGCMTTTWVDPENRRQGIAVQLRRAIFKAYGGMVYVSEMSEPARKSIDATSLFTALKPMQFQQVRVRIVTLDMLPKKFRLLQNLGTLFSWFDMLVNLPVKARLMLWTVSNKRDDKFRVEYLSEIDHDTARFIDKHQENNLVRRGAPELDWITRYPWVIQAPFSDVSTSKFFFSTVAKSFGYIKYRVLDFTGHIRAFVMLRLRDGRLHVPYLYFDMADAEMVTRSLCRHIIGLGVSSFETCNVQLVDQIRKIGFPVVTINVRDRHTRLSNELVRGADLNTICLQDGDGDKVFT